jgi:hypothetical protein
VASDVADRDVAHVLVQEANLAVVASHLLDGHVTHVYLDPIRSYRHRQQAAMNLRGQLEVLMRALLVGYNQTLEVRNAADDIVCV